MMQVIERVIIDLLLHVVSVEQLNIFLSDPQAVAVMVGALVSLSCALLGTHLLLRGMSLTSDAISHTVLLGIVVAFLVMVNVFNLPPDLKSPWLVLGAAAAGVATVILTELIYKSGLVKEDAALGLAFPLLFAIAIILISRHTDRVHLDTDVVLTGEIGIAWANTNSHCFDNCEDVIITPDDDRARFGRICINCTGGIGPRHPDAVFEETCTNCGTYTASQAWSQRLITEPPELVFWPRALTLMGIISLLNILFVTVLYKELKLATFDAALARVLGFRPGLLHYLLMVLVSLTAVGAFDAVGSILVVAFFIIPPATAYLLTDRLSIMMMMSAGVGVVGAATGYELARGNFLGIFEMRDLLTWLDGWVGLGGYTEWNVSISASMVVMLFFLFIAAWLVSPRYGVVLTLVRRRNQRRSFADQMLLGHVFNHQHTVSAEEELHVHTLHRHLNWTVGKTQASLARLRLMNYISIQDGIVTLTSRGEERVRQFRRDNLIASIADSDLVPGTAIGN